MHIFSGTNVLTPKVDWAPTPMVSAFTTPSLWFSGYPSKH